MSIPVVWYSWNSGATNLAHHWDQTFLLDALERRLWTPVNPLVFHHVGSFGEVSEGEGALVVVSARHEGAFIDRINADIAALSWVLVLLLGDEENSFPAEQITHPNMQVWKMTPQPGRWLGNGFVPNGYAMGTREVLQLLGVGGLPPTKTLDWAFAGQVTHDRRKECVEVLCGQPNGFLVESPGFTQGVDQCTYLKALTEARVAPCPAGPVHVETFRLYEALEAGCVPVCDLKTPGADVDFRHYWRQGFGHGLVSSFPELEDWRDLSTIIEQVRACYPMQNNTVSAWWQEWKRDWVYDLEDTIHLLRDTPTRMEGEGQPDDLITVLVPTSPVPSNPATTLLEETLASVRDYLPRAEIILMCDGVRPEQEHRRANYEEYLRRVLWKTNHVWHNVLPLRFHSHQHQANMTRATLTRVKTPLVLFVEHDAPLCGEIPFGQLAQAVLSTRAHMIRLHYDVAIHPEHQELMIGSRENVCGVPLLRTYQWSQRPHLAETFFYRKMLEAYFPHTCRTMIEDRVHGVLWEAFKNEGVAGWDHWRTWIYAPDGNMKRSTHTCARGDDPKYEMRYR